MVHADMSEDDRNRSMQMQSFLKHLESQMEQEEHVSGGAEAVGAPAQSFTSLRAE